MKLHNELNSSSKGVILILLGIILLGAALRLYQINYQSLWYDELHSIISTNPGNSVASIIEYCKSDQPPAFFLYLHAIFKISFYDDIVARIASALIGIVSIPVFYLMVKEFGDKRTGLFSALLVAVNYFHIYYSQEARFYTMAFLFSSLSYLFFIWAFRNTRIINFIFYCICTVILLYTHYFGLVIFAAQSLTFIVLIVFYRRDTKFIVAGILAAMTVIICFIPWIPVIMTDFGIDSFWIRKPTPYFMLEYFYDYFGKDVFVALVFGIFSILFFKLIWKNDENVKTKPLYIILLLWLVLSYLIPFVKSISGVPVLHIRYTIIALPAWIIIFAIGWSTIKNSTWKYVLVACITLSSLINLFLLRQHYTKIQKQQFRETSQFVKAKNKSNYPVYSAFAWHFNFYFRDSPYKVLSLQEVHNVQKFWLLQAEFFTPEEKDEELKNYTDSFEVAEKYPFYKTQAVLLIRKENKLTKLKGKD